MKCSVGGVADQVSGFGADEGAGYAGVEAAGDAAGHEGPQDDLGEVVLPLGGDGAQPTELDPDRAGVGEAAQREGGDDHGAFPNLPVFLHLT